MNDIKKSLIVETVASTSDLDSQGESVDLNGMDISPLIAGTGFLNVDHMPGFSNMIGHVTAAKKVMKAEDAETPFQQKEWSRLKKPFLSCTFELWSNTEHKEAKAVKAIYDHYSKKNEAPPLRISIEGKTLERGRGAENHILKRTLVRGLALTVQPSNKHTSSEVIQINKSLGLDENHFAKSSEYRVFTETKDDPITRLHQLVLVANQMLKHIKSK